MPSYRWHLDEMVKRIAGQRMYLWRGVDHEGEVLGMFAASARRSGGVAADALAAEETGLHTLIAGYRQAVFLRICVSASVPDLPA